MPEPQRPPLTYERPASSPIPRWQFRLLFLLVLVNLGITIQIAYAPGVGAAIKQWWAEQKATRQMQALQRQASKWTEPAGKVAWDENPESAAKLLAGPGYSAVQVPRSVVNDYPPLAGWPRSAGAKPPAITGQLFNSFPISQGRIIPAANAYGFVYLHAMKAPAGEERLVYVIVEGELGARLRFPPEARLTPGERSTPAEPFRGSVAKVLRLVAVPCRPAEGVKHPRVLDEDAAVLEIHPSEGEGWTVPFQWDPPAQGKPATVSLESRDRFRFYAGQQDPADPAHFTIDYELDGVKGKIHGSLKDDGAVELKPDGGTVWGQVWHPRK